MIPANFEYVRVDSVEGALEALKEHGDEAKLIAGGHSLLPLMKFRLAAPAFLVDINRLEELKYVEEENGHLRIGALTRHCDVENSELIKTNAGLLADATHHVGDPQVRHRGTIGGAIAHGDPASDIPSALIALRAIIIVSGPSGVREIPIDDFFTGFLETDLNEDELLTEIKVPKAPDAKWSFQKFNRRAQDWAIVGASILLDENNSGVSLINMHSTPFRSTVVEQAIASGATAEEASEMAAEGTEPTADINASIDYRKHLARILVKRGLEEAGR
ncbi:MAG: xanthine dehydrogenase family protein subunit M [Acidimicrobiales bacterium]|jgi:carbon-monoxide dehydrogenase medium subunit|nr:xanthine dehydrogenase family protein subunit M [Acidimicrobiales bacterium]HJM28054.1 xanthine dehydrogenase family protein subunit M [Acidimicrobiales bacterium]